MEDKTKQQNNNQNDGGKNMYTNSIIWPDEFKELLTFLNIDKAIFSKKSIYAFFPGLLFVMTVLFVIGLSLA